MNRNEIMTQIFSVIQLSVTVSANMKMTKYSTTFKDCRALKLELL